MASQRRAVEAAGPIYRPIHVKIIATVYQGEVYPSKLASEISSLSPYFIYLINKTMCQYFEKKDIFESVGLNLRSLQFKVKNNRREIK